MEEKLNINNKSSLSKKEDLNKVDTFDEKFSKELDLNGDIFNISNFKDVELFIGGDYKNEKLYSKAESLLKEKLKETRDEEMKIKIFFNQLMLDFKRKELVNSKTNQSYKKLIKQIFKVRNSYADEFVKNKFDKSYLKRLKFQLLAFESMMDNYLAIIERYLYNKGSNNMALETLVFRFRIKRTIFRLLKSVGFKYRLMYYWLTFLKFSSDYGTSFNKVSRTTIISIVIFGIFHFITDTFIIIDVSQKVVASGGFFSYLLYSMGILSNLGTMSTPTHGISEFLVFIEGLYGLLILGIFLNLFHQQMK